MACRLFRRLASVVFCAVLFFGATTQAQATGPEALSINPPSVPKNTAPASAVHVIRGLGFTPATTVTFDGVAGVVTFIDSRTLQVQVPTSTVGKVVHVVVSDAGFTDDLFPFLYTDINLYVRPTGNDSSNGTTPGTAKRTITSGLAAASTTSTTLIRVAEGTYNESGLAMFNGVVISGGWDIAFAQRDSDRFVTAIDAGRAGFAIRSGGLDSSQVLDGVTILNGQREALGGGGFVISGDNAVITNSVFAGNSSTSRGGGIYAVFTTAYGGTPIVSNNVLLGNRSYSNTGGGIGIYPAYTQGQLVDIAITGNYVLGNRSFTGRGGGLGLQTQAMYTYNLIKLKSVSNVFGDNNAASGGGVSLIAAGGGDRFDLLMDNNLLFGNSARGEGGGLFVGGVGHVTGTIRGLTVASNSAGVNGGGGVNLSPSILYEPAFQASNLIAWGNTNGNLRGAPLATWSDIQGGSPGTGNIDDDPGFVAGPMGNFYLMQGGAGSSPAVDAGAGLSVDASMEAQTTDAALLPDSGMVDMGFHYPPGVSASADPIAFTRIDPSRGDLGGADWVLVRGRGFDPGATVDFGGVPAADLIFVSSTRVLAKPPVHALGPVSVTVANPDLTSVTQPSAYQYVDNLPPAWDSTVGLQSALSGQDCVRSVSLTWNPATDAVSPPIVYSIHRLQCIPSTTSFTSPCDNYGYVPTAANKVGMTGDTFYIDTNYASGGADPKMIYMIRALDSASAPVNTEFNYAKRLVTVTKNTSDLTPPDPVGDTLEHFEPHLLDWEEAVGAVSYRVYRQTNAAAYAGTGLTPLITLTVANNDLDMNGVTDTRYNDVTFPALDQAFFYKITALDPCLNETLSELLP